MWTFLKLTFEAWLGRKEKDVELVFYFSTFSSLLLFFSYLSWRTVLKFLNNFQHGGVELSPKVTVDAIFFFLLLLLANINLSSPHSTYTSRKAKWQCGACQIKCVVLTWRKPPLFSCHRWQEPLPLRAWSIYWYCVMQQSNSNLLIFLRQLPPQHPHPHPHPLSSLLIGLLCLLRRKRQRKHDVFLHKCLSVLPFLP